MLKFAVVVFLTWTMYYYLHVKTRVKRKYIFIDGSLVILVSFIALLFSELAGLRGINSIIIGILAIPVTGFIITMIRFWRRPSREFKGSPNELISPADGNIIEIRECLNHDDLFSKKNGLTGYLDELNGKDLVDLPCLMVSINMTLFDVHVNSSPVSGRVVMVKHTPGKFLSLKKAEASFVNERTTTVINSLYGNIAVVQIASRLVRRIVSYLNTGEQIDGGDWIGMIRFGSQVDLLFPSGAEIMVSVGQQVFARQTIIARYNETVN